ncbi:MAG: hypothetical protein HQK49_19210 [Oligoflexia bacterium]|nr:hypothetical protein [Oligoflexia bacterium]
MSVLIIYLRNNLINNLIDIAKILKKSRVAVYGVFTLIAIVISINFWQSNPKILNWFNRSANFNTMVFDVSNFYGDRQFAKAREVAKELLSIVSIKGNKRNVSENASRENVSLYAVANAIDQLLSIIPLTKGEEFNGHIIIKMHAQTLGRFLSQNIDNSILNTEGRNSLNAFLCLYLIQNDSTETLVEVMEPSLYKQFVLFKNNPKNYGTSVNFYLEILNMLKLKYEAKIIKTEFDEKEALEYFVILHKSIDLFKFIDPPHVEYYYKMKKQFPHLSALDESFNQYKDKVKVVSVEIEKDLQKK